MEGISPHPRRVEVIEYPADWKTEGRHAALIRNERMLREGKPDLVIAFPGGNGTWYICSLGGKLSIPVVTVGTDRQEEYSA